MTSQAHFAEREVHPAMVDGRPLTIYDIPLTVANLPELRQRCVDLAPTDSGTGPAVDHVEDVSADGVPCRLYRSGHGQTRGAVIYAHGGGWIVGSLDTDDALCREIATRSRLPVLAVDYRLAPEHPYPAPILDVETATNWLRRAGDKYGVAANRFVIVGESAGAHIATVVARRARDGGQPHQGQILVNPVVDPAQAYPSGDGYREDAEYMRFYWDAYVPPGVDRTGPDLNPLAANLAGLPPTLRPEGERYATALAIAGVPTTNVRYLSTYHGFVNWLAKVYAAVNAAGHIAATACTMVK